jgi:Fe-S cluster assembly iron-binding protein IscA
MLTITTEAADAIRTVIDAAELPVRGGMRISPASGSTNGRGPTLALEIVDGPDPEDQIVREENATVFVDPIAAAHVDDKTLDADYEPGGDFTFSLREQP